MEEDMVEEDMAEEEEVGVMVAAEDMVAGTMTEVAVVVTTVEAEMEEGEEEIRTEAVEVMEVEDMEEVEDTGEEVAGVTMAVLEEGNYFYSSHSS